MRHRGVWVSWLSAAALAAGACDCGESGTATAPSDAGAPAFDASIALFPGPCTIEVDTDVDGRPETVTWLEYDAAGLLVLREDDVDGDGEIESRTFHEHDAEGNVLVIAEDGDADGSIDARLVSRYENGRVVEIVMYDGAERAIGRTTILRDPHGNAAVEEIDAGADGTVDWRGVYAYDGDSNLIREEHDVAADGELEVLVDHRWEGGLHVRTTVDRGVDGEADEETRYEHDVTGKLLRTTFDADADGTPEVLETRTYDQRGRLARFEVDLGADGVVDWRQDSVWDEHGNLLEERADVDVDGRVDSVTSFSYGCFE